MTYKLEIIHYEMAALFLFLIINIFPDIANDDKTIITEKLSNQAKCWNAGDIDCFMQDYWKSDSLMYIGKNGVTYGWQKTLDNYKVKYPTKKEMGNLTFEIVTLKKIDEQHFFMVGKWFLKREIGDVGGHFSLIWKKINGNWVIVADHSS